MYKKILILVTGFLFLMTSWLGKEVGGFKKAKPDQPEKYAIVFAIGDYPEASGWGKISSGNDVPLILSALHKQGFKEENIFLVTDAMATKKGIEQAFNDDIINKVKPGDVVFVHFSSHGQQIMDDNNDEIDGFDEAVIPYDAGLDFIKGEYEGERHMRDDELGIIFNKIRQKLGPNGNLLALLDACHSGTGTRGSATARGTFKKMAPADYKPQPKTSARGDARGSQSFIGSSVSDGENLAPMVIISGASADELNYETQDDNGHGVGSLSYAFSKVMANATKEMSYRELFDRIKVEMQRRVPQQTPQIEGTVDQQLFGGAFVEAKPYFLPDYWEDEHTIFLKSGTLEGLYDSTRVALFDLGAQDLATADTLAQGYILDASLTESYAVLDQPLDENSRQNVKVIITGQNYSSLKVKVRLDLNLDAEAVNILTQNIEASGAAELVEENPDLLITNKDISRSSAIEIFTLYDQSLKTIELNSTTEPALREASDIIIKTIKNRARTNFLRNLEMKDIRRDVALQIIPLKGKVTRGRFKSEGEMTVDDFRDEEGNIVFPEGQVFKLRVNNRGYRKAYFTILDFTPDEDLSLVVPNEASSMQPADYVIAQGQSIDLDQLFIMQAPFGNEMFKIIATEEPLDLRPVIDPIRGTRAGGSSNPFQSLMEDAASTSRSGTLSMGSSSANISSLSFRVAPLNTEDK